MRGHAGSRRTCRGFAALLVSIHSSPSRGLAAQIRTLQPPGDYHNGGVWPFVCGFYVAACVAAGQMGLAERKLLALTELVRPWHENAAEWGFNEWIHAQTESPVVATGRPGQPLCTYMLPSVCNSSALRSSTRSVHAILSLRGRRLRSKFRIGWCPTVAASSDLRPSSSPERVSLFTAHSNHHQNNPTDQGESAEKR